MSDEWLRSLERRWKETSCAEHEAAWLRSRVRAGRLGQRSLELAAYLGHEAAILVCGDVTQRIVSASKFNYDDSARDYAWCCELPLHWDSEVTIRLALELAWRRELAWRTVARPEAMDEITFAELISRPAHALSTYDRYLVGARSELDVAASYRSLFQIVLEWVDGEEFEGEPWDALQVIEDFYEIPGHLLENSPCCDDYVQEFESVEAFVGQQLRDVLLRGKMPRADVLQAKARVAAFVLGYSDPVAERVRAER